MVALRVVMAEETFASYLRRQLRHSGLGSQSELARRSGIDVSSVNKYFKGKLLRPEIETLAKFAPHLGVPIEELMEAAGYPAPSDVAQAPAPIDLEVRRFAELGRRVAELFGDSPDLSVVPLERVRLIRPEDAEPTILVPVYHVMPADHPDDLGRQVVDYVPIPIALWRRARKPLPIMVGGNCLSGRGIIKGDVVVVDTDNTEPRDGQIVAFRWCGVASLKLFYRTDEGIELRPTVADVPTIPINRDATSDLEIIGVSVGAVALVPRE